MRKTVPAKLIFSTLLIFGGVSPALAAEIAEEPALEAATAPADQLVVVMMHGHEPSPVLRSVPGGNKSALTKRQRIAAVIEKIIEGPTAAEKASGLSTALPAGTSIAAVNLSPDEKELTLRLDIVPQVMKSRLFNEDAVHHFAEQLHLSLGGEGLRSFTTLVKDPESGEYRGPLTYLTPPVEVLPEFDAGAAADTPGQVHTKATTSDKISMPANHGPITGALSGKTVVLNQAHGYLYDHLAATPRWRVQRSKLYDTIEDFSCAELLNLYVLPALHNVGAQVHTVREPDVQRNMVIVDNAAGSPTYIETGSWGTSSASRGFVNTTGASWTGRTVDPFANASATRFASVAATVTATATFTPNITAAGYYNVYITFSSSSNRAADAHFQVVHSGGTTDYRVNQQKDGATWLLLGNFYFEAGTAGKVVALNDGADTAKVITVDAVRFGGGMGDVNRHNTTVSGYERWREEAVQYMNYLGAFVTGSGLTNSSTSNDESLGWSNRPRYARWEQSRDLENVSNFAYVGFHTNAFNGGCVNGAEQAGTARGTASYRDVDADAVAGTITLASNVHSAVISGIRSFYQSSWQDRGVIGSNSYGECSQSNLGTVPGFFFEGLFGDNPSDAGPWKDAKFRMILARAIQQGLITYWGGNTFPPEPPTNLCIRNNGGNQVRLNWTPGPVKATGLPYGHAATGYRVFRSSNGFGFDNGTAVGNVTETFVTLAPGETAYFRIAATNSAGISFPTETLAVRAPISSGGTVPTFLIVNGSDRADQFMPQLISAPLTFGCVNPSQVRNIDFRTYQRANYIAQHAQALAAAGAAFDSCANECVEQGQIVLGNYTFVDWIGGQEAEADGNDQVDNTAIKSAAVTALQNYLQGGGNVFMSSSELAWDFDRSASQPASEIAFMTNFMKARFAADSANTYNASGAAGSIFASLGALTFDNGTAGIYQVRFPDVLTPTGGAVAALNYTGGTGGVAAVQYSGLFGSGSVPCKLVYMGFGFETITDSNKRNQMMSSIVTFFSPATVGEWQLFD